MAFDRESVLEGNAHERLVKMGLLSDAGNVNVPVMKAFAIASFMCFFESLFTEYSQKQGWTAFSAKSEK
jgi:hypothetical protein